jgi:hypothetical protein
MFQGCAQWQLNALAATVQDNSSSKKSKEPVPSSFKPPTQLAQKSWSIKDVIATHNASRSINQSGPDTPTALLWYINPNTCYGSEDWLDEDIHPDYIHPSLADEVKVATIIAAHAATKMIHHYHITLWVHISRQIYDPLFSF